MQQQDGLGFVEAQKAESQEIAASRARRRKDAPAEPGDDLVGLAFSGGGIRSATFNLGVVQALAARDLLRSVDYLSTVSGGGYIGSWLTAWIRRVGIDDVTTELAVPVNGVEASSVGYLRQYSNYLTPRMGLLGADTWTTISTYLRNLLLNMLIVLPALIAILQLPRLIMCVFLAGSDSGGWFYLGSGLFALLFAAFVTGRNLWIVADDDTLRSSSTSVFTRPWVVHWGILVPSLFAAYTGSCWLWQAGADEYQALASLAGGGTNWFPWAVLTAVAHAIAWLPAVVFGRRDPKSLVATMRTRLSMLLSAVASGMAGGTLLWLAAQQLWAWHAASAYDHAGAWAALAFGTPLLLVVFTLTEVLHIGFMSRHFSEYQREWWSRLGGWLMIYSGSWLLVFITSIWAPWYVAYGMRHFLLLASGVGIASVATTAAGLWSAVSARTSGEGAQNRERENPLLERLATFAPYVFCIGILVLLALILEIALAWGHWGTFKAEPTTAGRLHDLVNLIAAHHWAITWTSFDPARNVIVFAAAAMIVVVLSWRVDVNHFSMYHLYCNRLTRAYLGASKRSRKPHPFTGFDADDDIPLADLTTRKDYVGPYPLVNTALNLVRGEELAWQDRKATSFLLAPLWSGWGQTGYRPTASMAEGQLSLGTALAISGAAASPNMGYHSSAPLAFLMTIFNVRLGWWLGNPRCAKWENAGPRLGLTYLLAELFGYTNAKANYVYLSDGGHFENLGIYELVRRRCRLIVACDASQDENYVFSDLGSAIRKCRTDLGVEIRVDVTPLIPDPTSRLSKATHVVGTIHYPDRKGDGILVYCKPALIGVESPDIQNYAKEQRQFPHQSTGDQWFDEAQFESYRALGRQAGDRVVADVAEALRHPTVGLTRLPGQPAAASA